MMDNLLLDDTHLMTYHVFRFNMLSNSISQFIFDIVTLHRNSMIDVLMDGFMCTILITILRIKNDGCF